MASFSGPCTQERGCQAGAGGGRPFALSCLPTGDKREGVSRRDLGWGLRCSVQQTETNGGKVASFEVRSCPDGHWDTQPHPCVHTAWGPHRTPPPAFLPAWQECCFLPGPSSQGQPSSLRLPVPGVPRSPCSSASPDRRQPSTRNPHSRVEQPFDHPVCFHSASRLLPLKVPTPALLPGVQVDTVPSRAREAAADSLHPCPPSPGHLPCGPQSSLPTPTCSRTYLRAGLVSFGMQTSQSPGCVLRACPLGHSSHAHMGGGSFTPRLPHRACSPGPAPFSGSRCPCSR